jgi:formylglycine-generating enzyme required for sulfatase activity
MSAANNLTGKTLNKRYEILRPLGKGGMGKVYLAKDMRFGKQVVVKVPTMEVGDKEFKARFMREIASLANLEHPHIVSTLDWGEIEGIPFLVLRYLGGGSLRDRITDSQGLKKLMPLEGLNQWLPQIASALDFIHAKNWVHRDLKPDNILFDEASNPYLADFGIAKALEGAPMGVKTTMGAFIGTPQYMAPEMHLGKGIGPKADQFGLAVLVYESIAGKIPFAGETSTAIFLDVMRGKPKLIHELVSRIPLEKSNALMKGLAKDQDKRHDNCGLFASEITGIKLGTGLVFQGNGEVSISGQIEPLQMKPPIKTGFSGIPEEAPSIPELAATRVIRKDVIPLSSQIPAKVEEAFILPELPLARVIRKDVTPFPLQQVQVEEDETYIRKRQKNSVNLKVVSWVVVILILVIIIVSLVSNPSDNKQYSIRTKEESYKPKQEPKQEPEQEPIFLESPFSAEKAKTAQEKLAKSLGKPLEAKINLGPGVNLDMVLIPAGKFEMGSPVLEKGRSGNEMQHEVVLTNPFYMSKYEVTQEQWEEVMGENPSSMKGTKLPVMNVSWEDCQEFIKKLNKKTNGGYRLPTESEWEFACRAGTITAYSFGDEITPKDANFKDSNTGEPVAVASYKPNAFGLYDMHGNVWEWCEDWYGDYPEGKDIDPKGPAMAKFRVLRGGSFMVNDSRIRSSYRNNFSWPVRSLNSFGFRLARTMNIEGLSEKEEAKIKKKAEEAEAKEIQKKAAMILNKEVEEKADLGKDVSLDMVLIPAGNFMMGSPESEKGRADHETQHAVTLTKPFYMGKYEVTQEQWESVMGNNPSNTKGEKLPVTNVSWDDCQNFIKKLNEKNKGKYRLPTEAEWEYACRAGTTTAYSFGDSITKSDANYGGSDTKAVGSYKPNAFGLYDMHGNVYEWCEDWKADYPKESVIDPKGPATGDSRVLRGGFFLGDESRIRSSYRSINSPTYRDLNGGFRLAKTP